MKRKKETQADLNKRMAALTNDEALAFYAKIQERVGTTARERLAWAVRAVQKPQKDFTPGDWDNLRAELTAFALGPAFPALSLPSGYREMLKAVGEGKKAKNPAPVDRSGDFPMSEQEAKDALARMGSIIQKAVKREMVVISQGKVRVLGWIPSYSQWMPLPGESTLADQAGSALGDVLERAGHLLKECPAPLPRDHETCGVWFVASRPRQEYCSAACQSRASTRTARARQAEKEG